MEKTKLTVRLPRYLIEGAKKYADDHETTVTRLVLEYFRHLSAESDPLKNAPVVQRLSGILAQEASLGDYQQYLEEKYGDPASRPD